MALKLLCQSLLVLGALGSVLPPRADQCPALPTNYSPRPNPKLPDPFLQLDGTRITKKDEWTCQRDYLSQLIQKYELGDYPAPPESVTASLSGSTLSITVRDKEKSISFSVSIRAPSSGGSGPFPAIIAYGGPSIPIPSGIATIIFNNDEIAQQINTGSRGKGKFYDLYGSGATASAMLAWAWGGALVAGAFVDRIALTLPQESGSGGAACWRLSDEMKRRGINVQTASQIITENVWLSRSFEQFARNNNVPGLPIDHHELAGMVAPRALLVIENTSQVWLGNMATYGCMKTAHKIWEALGVPENMGFTQTGDHSHCQWSSSQSAELTAFIDKFLRGTGTANTNIIKTDNPNLGFVDSDWVDWYVPTLV
ncbi:hypothetical protein VTH82DRAFT_2653 [Thermothelomyces myriococcoides]